MLTRDSYLPSRTSYKKSFLVIMLLLLIYFLDYLPLREYMSGFQYTYILKPLIWFGIFFFILKLPSINSSSKLKHRKFIYMWAFNFAFIYILVNVFAGLIGSFGKSPYDQSIRGIFINIIFVGSTLIGREFARNYLVNNLAKKENYLVLIGVSLLMTITNYSIGKYMELNSLQSTVTFFAESFVPDLTHNIFATYLSSIGGHLASIIYLGLIQAFTWLSPVLPNLKWIVTALIGIICPVFFMMIFQSVYLTTAKLAKKRNQDKERPFGWLMVSVISICLIWFAVGVFPIYPSVIVTGSMEPLIYAGDVILVDKISTIEEIENLKVDDIIQFRRDSILISHRILEIEENDEYGLLFTTKGDNNSGPDVDQVKPQDISGRIEYVVPNIGWPTIFLRSKQDISIDDVVF